MRGEVRQLQRLPHPLECIVVEPEFRSARVQTPVADGSGAPKRRSMFTFQRKVKKSGLVGSSPIQPMRDLDTPTKEDQNAKLIQEIQNTQSEISTLTTEELKGRIEKYKSEQQTMDAGDETINELLKELNVSRVVMEAEAALQALTGEEDDYDEQVEVIKKTTDNVGATDKITVALTDSSAKREEFKKKKRREAEEEEENKRREAEKEEKKRREAEEEKKKRREAERQELEKISNDLSALSPDSVTTAQIQSAAEGLSDAAYGENRTLSDQAKEKKKTLEDAVAVRMLQQELNELKSNMTSTSEELQQALADATTGITSEQRTMVTTIIDEIQAIVNERAEYEEALKRYHILYDTLLSASIKDLKTNVNLFRKTSYTDAQEIALGLDKWIGIRETLDREEVPELPSEDELPSVPNTLVSTLGEHVRLYYEAMTNIGRLETSNDYQLKYFGMSIDQREFDRNKKEHDTLKKSTETLITIIKFPEAKIQLGTLMSKLNKKDETIKEYDDHLTAYSSKGDKYNRMWGQVPILGETQQQTALDELERLQGELEELEVLMKGTGFSEISTIRFDSLKVHFLDRGTFVRATEESSKTFKHMKKELDDKTSILVDAQEKLLKTEERADAHAALTKLWEKLGDLETRCLRETQTMMRQFEDKQAEAEVIKHNLHLKSEENQKLYNTAEHTVKLLNQVKQGLEREKAKKETIKDFYNISDILREGIPPVPDRPYEVKISSEDIAERKKSFPMTEVEDAEESQEDIDTEILDLSENWDPNDMVSYGERKISVRDALHILRTEHRFPK